MPDILASDAKRCVKGAPLLRGQGGAQDSVSEQLFENILDLWQVIDVSLLSNGEPDEVLPNGGDPSKVASIFPSGIKLPTAVAHACGEYAGQVAVRIGLISAADSIDVALEEDPQVFEKAGLDLEQVRAGLKVLDGQVKGLAGLAVADKVHCTAIYQAASVSDGNLGPYFNIWRAALIGAIEAGELDPAQIDARSVYWQALATTGAEAVTSTEGYQAQATRCDGWINEAVAKQAAG
jgi:hypothetical protein